MCFAIDGGQQRFDILGHVWVVRVEWLRVGGLGYQDGLLLVASARSWVDASEPGLSSSVVTMVSDVNVERAQVAFGMGEIIRGDMCNDEVASIDRLSNTALDLRKAENKTGNDGWGEHS